MRQLLSQGLFILLLALSSVAWAASGGQVDYLSGTLTVKKQDGTLKTLAKESTFDAGDVLTTAPDSFARLKFVDGAMIAMRPNTVLNVGQVEFEAEDAGKDNFAVSLVKGGLRAVTGAIGKRSKDKVQYGTPVATVGIRGTHFGLLTCQAADCEGLRDNAGEPLREGLHADVVDGAVEVKNDAGAIIVNAGEFAYVADKNTAPEPVDPARGFRVKLPLSVMFDENAQLWSEGSHCATCTMP